MTERGVLRQDRPASPLVGTSAASKGLNEVDSTLGNPAMKSVLFAIALAFAVGPLAAPLSAEAKGCLKGALVGGVDGHFAGHHGVLGAIGGCIVGRHMANEKKGQAPTASAPTQHPANPTNGY